MTDVLIEELEIHLKSRCIHARLSNLPWKYKLMNIDRDLSYDDVTTYSKIACEIGDILYSREMCGDAMCSDDLFQMFEDFIKYMCSNCGFITPFDIIKQPFLNSYSQECDCIQDDDCSIVEC